MKSRLSYANVAATVALTLSLTGTAYAAGVIIKSPSQLGKGVVTNAKVKKATLKANRLTPAARAQLKGAKGDKGDPGTAKAYGEVSAIGVLSNAVGTTSATKPAIPAGLYCLDLAVPAKTITVTVMGVATATSAGAIPGPFGGCAAGTDFTIIPLDKDGLAADSGFYFAAN